MIKNASQFIIALLLAVFVLVIIIVISPYLAMQTAWVIVTGEGKLPQE